MNTTSEVTFDAVVESLLEVLPQVWDRIRSNFRSAGTSRFGISMEQFHTLRHIYRGYCHCGEIAEKRQVSRSAVSQATDALVAKGLVARLQDKDDRRQVRLELTPYARRVLDENAQENRAYIRGKISAIGPGERETVLRAMDILKNTFLSA
jgi:DNA-binding MarR family transcriptional regulator